MEFLCEKGKQLWHLLWIVPDFSHVRVLCIKLSCISFKKNQIKDEGTKLSTSMDILVIKGALSLFGDIFVESGQISNLFGIMRLAIVYKLQKKNQMKDKGCRLFTI